LDPDAFCAYLKKSSSAGSSPETGVCFAGLPSRAFVRCRGRENEGVCCGERTDVKEGNVRPEALLVEVNAAAREQLEGFHGIGEGRERKIQAPVQAVETFLDRHLQATSSWDASFLPCCSDNQVAVELSKAL
jgi:hypothetical protein